MTLRTKIILIGALLCIALVAATIAAAASYHDYQALRQQNTLAREGDVRTIRSWMTIPYIARVYHVPESYLYQRLHVQDTGSMYHATLHILAGRLHQPINTVIQNVQASITAYRSQHTQTMRGRPQGAAFLAHGKQHPQTTVGRGQ